MSFPRIGARVKRVIKNREIISVAAGPVSLQGTYHRAVSNSEELNGTRPIGILIANSGVLPRSATGDSAVYWADSLAQAGYPSFRLDFEGLGDTPGDVPQKLLDFVARVNAGCFVPSLTAAIQTVVEQFQLAGMVILGHCAGTVSVLYAAAVSRHIVGVVLLDPYFHLQEPDSQAAATVRPDLQLPCNVNLQVIACWNQVVSAGIPVLVLTAPSLRANPRDFDYLTYLLARSPNPGLITVESIEGAPHSFAEGPGKDGVRKHIDAWLTKQFSGQPTYKGHYSGNGKESSATPVNSSAVEV